MAYKVFTNGSVLNASEINENLMRQSVIVFSNAAARTAAITSPVEGMLTWLEDLNRYESYNGSAWVDIAGMALVASVSFTGTSSVIISNCFSAQYDNYFITIAKASGGSNTQLQLRTGSTTQTSGYAGLVLFGTGGGASVGARSSSAFQSFAESGDFTTGYLSAPFLTRGTIWQAVANQGSLPGLDAATNSATTSFESLVLSYGSNATGVIRIYGLRN